MKNRFNKKIIIIFTSLMLFVCIVGMASSSLDVFTKKYVDLKDEEVYKKILTYTFLEICEEVNILSKKGVEYSQLLPYAASLIEKKDDISVDELLDIIENNKNSENLRVLCTEILDYDENTFIIKDFSRLEKILLDEKEDSLLKQNIIWLLPQNTELYDILEELVFRDDELLAFQALKKLNVYAPERARIISNTLIRTEGLNEKLRIAIQVISLQLAESDNIKEKDEWISFCLEILKKSEHLKDDLMRDTVIFSLSDMRYSKALYEIVNNEEIDASYKKFSIKENQVVLIDTLEANPTEYDIEMAIKAMTIFPIDKTVDALKAVTEKSEKKYNLNAILSQEMEAADDRYIGN